MESRDAGDIVISSKTQTQAQIDKVLKDSGYDVTEVVVDTQQKTPEEEAAETEAAATAATEAQAETDRVAAEDAEKQEAERLSHNQKRRARQKAEFEETKNRAAAAEAKTLYLESQIEELRKSTTKASADVEDLRNNPPRAAEPDPLPDPPKRPKKTDFFEADDPDEAYEDAMYKFRRAQDKHEGLVEERKKPKAVPAVVETPAPAAAPKKETPAAEPATATAEIKDPVLRRFYTSIDAVSKEKAGIDVGKILTDNLPNLSEATITAMHVYDEPARIALYLAQHPEESKRIKVLTEGAVSEDPRKVRIAQKELDKIEQLAAEEDAAAAKTADTDDEEEDESTGDPETDASAARVSKQPQSAPAARPAPKAAPPAAGTPPAKPQPKKHDPIDPVGARGSQTAKSYDKMTAAEQKALSIDEVRKMRGML